MASRDVDLVIRAKDQTTKVVDQIVKVLNDFVDSTEDTAKGTSKADSSINRLGKAFAGLDKTLRGLSAAERVVKLFDQAAAGADRLDKSLSDTRSEVDRLQGAMAEAAANTAKLNQRLGETERAVKQQSNALKENQTAHKTLNGELRAAITGRSKLETAEKNLTKTIADQEARLARTQDRYNQIAAEIASVDAPSKRLANSLDAANRALEKQQGQLAQSRAALADTKAGLETAGQAVADLTARVEQSSAGLAQQKKAIADTEKNYNELKTAAREAERAEAQLGKTHARTAQQLQALEKESSAVADDLQKMRTESERAEQAMLDLAQATRGPLVEAYRQQQSVISRINNEYQEHRKELAALSALMGQVGVPTREMVETYNRLNAVSREVQTEFRDQQQVLKALRAALQETTTDSAQLAQQQRQFASAVTEGNAALNRVTQSTAQAATASQRLVQQNQQAAAAYQRVTNAAAQTAGATGRLSQANDEAAESYRRQANASRQAMSYTQRLRGEVLSLISAYGGIFGVIELLNKTIKAYQTLEGATSRLTALNDGNNARTANDLDFIRRNADRLGLEFGLLADEYTKFAAATKGTVIAGQETRDIFLSIAEAGRVNKLSFEDMQGIFRAVIQIASKGKFQLEELSGQLGDRLPGALKILADGLGVTQEELLEMTKNGEVMADNLTKFADELDKRYKSALPAALKSTTTALGQLQNAAFQALIVFAEGGFIEGFTKMVRDLTEVLKDPAFLSFAQRLSAGFGLLAETIGVAAKNFDVIAFAISGLIGLKLSGWLIAAGSSFLKMGGSATAGAAAVSTAAAATTAAGTAAATTAARVGLLTRAFQLLTSSTGVGLLLTGVSLAIGYWATSADEATDALSKHRGMVDQVRNAYDATGQSVDQWRSKIEKLTVTEAKANLARMKAAADAARADAAHAGWEFIQRSNGIGSLFRSDEANKAAEAIRKLSREFASGERDLDSYKAALTALAEGTADEEIKEVATRMLEAAEGTRTLEESVKEAALVVKAFGPDSAEAEKAIKALAGTMEEAATSTDDGTAALQKYKSVIEELKGLIPEFADELEKMKAQAELNGIIGSLGFNQITPEVLGLARRAQEEVNNTAFKSSVEALKGFSDGVSAAAELIRRKEDFRATPYDDGRRDANGRRIGPAVYRAGYGSDTYTTASGEKRQVVKGVAVSMADAQRDLMRRITTEFMPKVVSAVGAERFGSFNPQQQAVLTSIAYNYGSIPDRIVAALKTGTTEEIANAIRGLGGDNGGINRKRRNEEAFLFANGDFQDKAAQDILDKEQKRLETAKEFHETQRQNIEQMQFELSIKDQDLIKQEQAKAIREAELEAKKAGTQLTAQEREEILKNVEAKYREEAAQDALNKKKEAAQEAEQKVNDLLARRTELENQLLMQAQAGDSAAAEQTKAQIEGINTELQAAIANAVAMYEALGGTGADAAIAKLQTVQMETQNYARTTLLDWTRVGELFASGLTNAFDRFAQSVAEGKKVGEAAAEAFLQFAADFLIEIGKMIIQQTILNALRALGGPFAGLGVPVGHTGGLVGSKRIGSGNGTRRIDPMMFAAAPRFHSGGVPGLKPGEVAAVLKEDEEVLTRNDPRHILNGGASPAAAASAAPQIKIVNAFDSATVVSEGLSSGTGEETFLNVVRSNASTIRDILS